MAQPPWPANQIEILKHEWSAGTKTAEITLRVNRVGPTRTKSAVVGMAHRLNLPGRENPIKPRSGEPVVRAPRAPVAPAPKGGAAQLAHAQARQAEVLARPPAPAEPPRPVDEPPAPRLSRRHTCQWPVREEQVEGRWRHIFCGAAALEGKSYCPEHHELSRAKPRDNREDAA